MTSGLKSIWHLDFLHSTLLVFLTERFANPRKESERLLAIQAMHFQLIALLSTWRLPMYARKALLSISPSPWVFWEQLGLSLLKK